MSNDIIRPIASFGQHPQALRIFEGLLRHRLRIPLLLPASQPVRASSSCRETPQALCWRNRWKTSEPRHGFIKCIQYMYTVYNFCQIIRAGEIQVISTIRSYFAYILVMWNVKIYDIGVKGELENALWKSHWIQIWFDLSSCWGFLPHEIKRMIGKNQYWPLWNNWWAKCLWYSAWSEIMHAALDAYFVLIADSSVCILNILKMCQKQIEKHTFKGFNGSPPHVSSLQSGEDFKTPFIMKQFTEWSFFWCVVKCSGEGDVRETRVLTSKLWSCR